MRVVSLIGFGLSLSIFAHANTINTCNVSGTHLMSQKTTFRCLSGDMQVQAWILTQGYDLIIEAQRGDIIFMDTVIQAFPEEAFEISKLELPRAADGQSGSNGITNQHRSDRNGNPGGPGEPGFDGRDGLSSGLIEITAGEGQSIKGNLAINNSATDGQKGGPGGNPGRGGNGVQGPQAAVDRGLGCHKQPSPGGNGGDSGPLGPGGNGGQGGDAGDIYLSGNISELEFEILVQGGIGGETGENGLPSLAGKGAQGRDGSNFCPDARDGKDGKVITTLAGQAPSPGQPGENGEVFLKVGTDQFLNIPAIDGFATQKYLLPR